MGNPYLEANIKVERDSRKWMPVPAPVALKA